MIFCGFYLCFFVGLNITMIATILPELKEKSSIICFFDQIILLFYIMALIFKYGF